MSGQSCPFCEIIAGRAPAKIVEEWPAAIAIVPLNPVVDGHLLVIEADALETRAIGHTTEAA